MFTLRRAPIRVCFLCSCRKCSEEAQAYRHMPTAFLHASSYYILNSLPPVERVAMDLEARL
jgi:hypothetical protein